MGSTISISNLDRLFL